MGGVFWREVEALPIPRGIFAWLDGPSVKTEGPGEKRGETGFLFLMPEGTLLKFYGGVGPKSHRSLEDPI